MERFVTLPSFHPDKGDVLVLLRPQVLIIGRVYGHLQLVVGIDGEVGMRFSASASLRAVRAHNPSVTSTVVSMGNDETGE